MTIKGRKGDTVVEVDEAPRRGSSLEALAKLRGLASQGRLAHGRQLARRQRRRRRDRRRLRRVGRGERQGDPRRDHRPGVGRRRLRAASPSVPAVRGVQGARQGRPAAERHRPLGDQRGVRLGRAELDPDARHRRGSRQRQRRRGRARPPDRRLGRAHHRDARARAAPARRRLRLRGDLLRRRPGRRGHRARGIRGNPERDRGARGAHAGRAGRAQCRVLRPRSHADGRLVRPALRSRGVRRRHDQPPPPRGRHVGRTALPPASARPMRAPRRCARAWAPTSKAATVRDMQRLAPRVLAGVLPRLYPQMLEVAYAPPGRRAARLHLHGRVAGDGERAVLHPAASTARSARARRCATASTPAARAGLFAYREEKARAIRELARCGRDIARRLVCLLGLRIRPPDAASRGQPRCRQPRYSARPRRPRRRLGGAALRSPAPAAEDRRGAGRGGCRRPRRIGTAARPRPPARALGTRRTRPCDATGARIR